ncbi:MAG: 3-oxoacyl-ACP synthase, partial [Pseudonocardiaceae bacterium]|nr:3-oxoacyl-ACP synthase [Pseudonocardiaceae bacterium]
MVRRTERFDVAVTGLGLVTPAGIGVEPNWKTVVGAASTADRYEELAGLPVDFCCRVPGFDPVEHLGRRVAWRLDRVTQLGMVAAREAIADAGLDPRTWDGARVGVVVGTSFGGSSTYEREHLKLLEEGAEWVSPLLMVMAPVNMTAGHVAIDTGASGPNMVVSTACAAGTTAIGTARMLLESDMCDVVIAGGAESSLTRTTIASLANMGAMSTRMDEPATASRPFDADRDGFVAAEGAGMLILE